MRHPNSQEEISIVLPKLGTHRNSHSSRDGPPFYVAGPVRRVRMSSCSVGQESGNRESDPTGIFSKGWGLGKIGIVYPMAIPSASYL